MHPSPLKYSRQVRAFEFAVVFVARGSRRPPLSARLLRFPARLSVLPLDPASFRAVDRVARLEDLDPELELPAENPNFRTRSPTRGSKFPKKLRRAPEIPVARASGRVRAGGGPAERPLPLPDYAQNDRSASALRKRAATASQSLFPSSRFDHRLNCEICGDSWRA